MVFNGLQWDSRKPPAAALHFQSRLNGGGGARRRALNIGAAGQGCYKSVPAFNFRLRKTIEID